MQTDIMENKDEQEVRIPRKRRKIAVVVLIILVLIVIAVPLAVLLPPLFKKTINRENCTSCYIFHTKEIFSTSPLLYTSLQYEYATASAGSINTTTYVHPVPTLVSSAIASSSSIVSALPTQADCNLTLVSVGPPVKIHSFSGVAYGVWMRDSSTYWGNETIFVMKDDVHKTKKLYRYNSTRKLKNNELSMVYELPFDYDGTGAVLYNEYLYYNRKNTNLVLKYNVARNESVKQFVIKGYEPGNASYSFPRKSGGIDLAVDELGVWVLWGSKDINYGLKAALLDSSTYSTTHSWNVTTKAMNTIGNAFIICGVVYTLDNHYSVEPNINLAFDTKTGKRWKPGIQLNSTRSFITMLDYNPTDKLLYCWNNGELHYYPLLLNGTRH